MGQEATARRSGGAADSVPARAQVPPRPASRLLAREPAPVLAPARAFFQRPRSPAALPRKAPHPPQSKAVGSSLHGKEGLPQGQRFPALRGVTLSTFPPALRPYRGHPTLPSPYRPQHTTKNLLRSPQACGTLFLRLLFLYRLWVVKRSQGHTCGHFFVRETALQSSRTKLEDGRGSVEGLGTWASDSSNVVLSRNPADGKE